MTLISVGARRRAPSQPSPLSLTTSFEDTQGAALTDYTEQGEYLAALAAESPLPFVVSTYGTSMQGRSLRTVTIGSGAGNPIVMLAGMHGNEPTTVDAVLTFMRELVQTDDATLLSMLSVRPLVVIPNANPDGREWNPIRRTNANNVDLNRDCLAVTQTESRALVTFISSLEPLTIADHHENILAPEVAFMEYGIAENKSVPPSAVSNALAQVSRFASALTAEGLDNGWYIPAAPLQSTTSVFAWHGHHTNLTESSPPMDMRTVETRDSTASRWFRFGNNVTMMWAWLRDVAANQAAYVSAYSSAQAESTARTSWDLTGTYDTPRPGNNNTTGTVVEVVAYSLTAAQYAATEDALTAHGLTVTPDGDDYLVSLNQPRSAVAVQLLDPSATERVIDDATRVTPTP